MCIRDSCYRVSKGVTVGYRVLYGVTGCYIMLKGVTGCAPSPNTHTHTCGGASWRREAREGGRRGARLVKEGGARVLQLITGGYTLLHVVTGCYTWLQDVTGCAPRLGGRRAGPPGPPSRARCGSGSAP
eukprot:3884285-Pyramimonas_sp.AAC.1